MLDRAGTIVACVGMGVNPQSHSKLPPCRPPGLKVPGDIRGYQIPLAPAAPIGHGSRFECCLPGSLPGGIMRRTGLALMLIALVFVLGALLGAPSPAGSQGPPPAGPGGPGQPGQRAPGMMMGAPTDSFAAERDSL